MIEGFGAEVVTEAIRREILNAPKVVVMSAAEELIQRGFQRGIQEGLAEGKRSTLTKMLQLKFRTLPASVADRIAHGSPEQLDRWVEHILTAASIEDVFAAD